MTSLNKSALSSTEAVKDREVKAFGVIGAHFIQDLINQDPHRIINIVHDTYIAHHRNLTVNPDSYFLRLSQPEGSRIIALPASVQGDRPALGLKWISGFPNNIRHGLPRASAVIILNDPETGRPKACLEGSIISAVRTAASGVLAAELVHPERRHIRQFGVVGTGPIAKTIVSLFLKSGWRIDSISLFDVDRERAAAFATAVSVETGITPQIHSASSPLLNESDLILFATTAMKPHVNNEKDFAHRPTILHISLRDIAPSILLGAYNVVDDVDHALKADTSLHLAEQLVGHRNFMSATIPELALGMKPRPGSDQLRVISPFGMGILDIALAGAIYEEAVKTGSLCLIEDFLE